MIKKIIGWGIFTIIIGGPIALNAIDSMVNYYQLSLPIAIGIGIALASIFVVGIMVAEEGSNIGI